MFFDLIRHHTKKAAAKVQIILQYTISIRNIFLNNPQFLAKYRVNQQVQFICKVRHNV